MGPVTATAPKIGRGRATDRGAFDRKVVVVTGGALGVGRATAIEFARQGAQVTVADVNEAAGQSTIDAIETIGAQAHLVIGDVARASQCQRVVRETVETFGRLDVLFNNVGIQPLESYRNVEDTPEEMWDSILEVT